MSDVKLQCGACRALVVISSYLTCDNYCAAQTGDLVCKSAMEDTTNNCDDPIMMSCSDDIYNALQTSDAICECVPFAAPTTITPILAPTTKAPTAVPTQTPVVSPTAQPTTTQPTTTMCADGVQNAFESDVDCGGGVCPHCQEGQRCLAQQDCVGVCSGLGVCEAPDSEDAAKDNTKSGDGGGGSSTTVIAAAAAGGSALLLLAAVLLLVRRSRRTPLEQYAAAAMMYKKSNAADLEVQIGDVGLDPHGSIVPYPFDSAEASAKDRGGGGNSQRWRSALYDYAAKGDDELSFLQGEQLQVADGAGAAYVNASNKEGRSGRVPANYF